jgi:hypothetical protein
VSDAVQWLAARLPAPPVALADRIVAAVRATEAAYRAPGASRTLPTLLGDAGVDLLRSTLRHSGDDVALDLLAADALLTYACEAAAELGDEALARLHEELSPARFAALLEANRE